MHSFSESNSIHPKPPVSSKEMLVSEEELKNQLIENMKMPKYNFQNPIELSNAIKKMLKRNSIFKIDIHMWETLTKTFKMLNVFSEAYKEMGLEKEFMNQFTTYHHYYFGYYFYQAIPFKLILSDFVITAKGYSLLAEHYNKKHKELYGYFAVGFFDVKNETFYHLLSSLDQAKDGTQFGMFYLFDRGGAPSHATAIKCEKINGKIHLIVAETDLDDSEDIEIALNELPQSFLDRIVLYKNTEPLQYTSEPTCFALSIKYMQKMKSSYFVKSLKARDLLKPYVRDSGSNDELYKKHITRVSYRIPPEFAYLITSPDALEKYANKNKEVLKKTTIAKKSEETKETKNVKPLTQLSPFEQYALKSRSGYTIESPKLIPNRNYPDKDKYEYVYQNNSIFYFQEKQKAIISNLYKSKTLSELKDALDFMNPLYWHINDEGEYVPYITTLIVSALKDNDSQKVINILREHNNLMHIPLNQHGHSLLHLAVEWSSAELMKYLIENNVDYRYTDKEGNTALVFGEKLSKKYIHRGSLMLKDIIKTHQEKIQHKIAYTSLIKNQAQKQKNKRKAYFFEQKAATKAVRTDPKSFRL